MNKKDKTNIGELEKELELLEKSIQEDQLLLVQRSREYGYTDPYSDLYAYVDDRPPELFYMALEKGEPIELVKLMRKIYYDLKKRREIISKLGYKGGE